MKKYLFSLIFLFVSFVGFSQKGLSYQAVILDPTPIEIPGQDIAGQPLVNGEVWLKFSIYTGSLMQFEELQKTKTDGYGLVNLLIGSVASTSFNSLTWDGVQKSMQVLVSFNQGASYTKVSDQKLYYNPYALYAETAGKLGSVLAIADGGTGATTAADARVNLGLGNIDNTSDAAKPISTATKAALDLKANVSDVTAALAAKADTGVIKAYVDSKIVSSNSTSSNQSSSSTTISNISNVALALKANTTDVTLALAAKADTAYVITKVAAATIADADANTKGKIQLAGDLAGTASAPTIPGLALKANAADLVTLTSVVTSNTASITANTNAILLKAPIASPVFTGTVAIGTANPSAAAVLDITSTSKGLLLPRLTFAQKSAIISPEAGLILWCSDCGTNGELQVYNGTNFVNMVGANAQFALPAISATSAASAITSSALTSGGSIDSDGGAFVTARGVVWNTSTNPTVSLSTKTTDGTGIGTFSSSLTGLTSGVTYYVKTYATNSVGTKYGPEITVNTAQAVATLASTTAASSIGATTATSGGNITYNGGVTVTVSGLVWSTSSNPTIALTTKTSNGSATETFTSNITGLTPGTLYYVRSYATNNVGTSYGAQTSFTTLNIPTVSSTTAASSLTSSSAVSGGTISADGRDAVTTRGIVYGTSAGSSTYSVTSGSGTGTFTSNITGLTPATTYYVRSFATNSVGTGYGTEISFTSLAIAPTLTTTAATSITKYAASAGGTITSNGGSTITASGICWSTTATPTTADSKTTDGLSSGTYSSTLISLTAGTPYYVRAYATNAIGTSYGAAQSFTTLSTPPSQTTVLIGSQRWTDKNLDVANYRNGDPVTYAANATDWNTATNAGIGAWSYYNFDATNGLIFGKLYNWYAVNDSRGLAPAGYHIPTKVEYNTLQTNYSGSAIKAASSEWGASMGTNTTGFTGLPGGNNNITLMTRFEDKGTSGWFWTSDYDLANTTKAYFRLLHISAGFVDVGSYPKTYGFSVRLVKDDNSIISTNPTLATTTTATNVNSTSATSGGNVIDEGATQVSVRGLVYGTTSGSSTYSVTIGSGDGTFSSTLTGLTQGTTYYVRSFATNVQGTGYGAETSFTTQTTATVSVTATPTSLTTTSAVGGGTISSNGGATITTSGLVWDASANPTIALSTKTTDGTTSGTFTSSITGLTQGTTYHARAYASNYLGTSYGPDITFTTITTPNVSSTATVTSITGTTATSGGTITTDGGASVTVRGLVWGTSTGSSTYSVTTGTGTGTYTSSLTGLSVATTYFVRAFATNGVGTVYGPEVLFNTPSLPTLTASAISIANNSTGVSATLTSELTSDGGATTTRGFIYGIGSFTITSTSTGTSIGTYSATITGLTAGSTYQVKTFATNSAGTVYATLPTSFTTPNYATLDATYSATNITGTTAESGGNVTADGGATVTERGLVWGTSSGSATYSVTISSGTGTFTGTLTGLSGGNTYFVRSFATNSVGTKYGAESSFSTVIPTVTSAGGKIWMDRNLGATSVATSATDASSFGGLYQWGRGTDGHQLRNASILGNISNTDTPGNNKFIKGADWRSPKNDNLWQGITGTNNPCPSGFRLPTKAEWETEFQSWSNRNEAGAFASPLKLPSAGYRDFGDGSISYTFYHRYWTSTTNGDEAESVIYDSGWIGASTQKRGNGMNCRCIKN